MNTEFIIPIGVLMVIGWVIKVLSDNRLRGRLIDKGVLDENAKFLFMNQTEPSNLSSLKWGLVLLGLGLALFIGQLFPSSITNDMTVGGMFIFAGLGFLVYYFVARRIIEQSRS